MEKLRGRGRGILRTVVGQAGTHLDLRVSVFDKSIPKRCLIKLFPKRGEGAGEEKRNQRFAGNELGVVLSRGGHSEAGAALPTVGTELELSVVLRRQGLEISQAPTGHSLSFFPSLSLTFSLR